MIGEKSLIPDVWGRSEVGRSLPSSLHHGDLNRNISRTFQEFFKTLL